MNIKQEQGKRLEELLKDQKITQQELAEAIPISVVSVSNWKRGKQQISERNVDRILELYPCSRPFEYSKDNPEVLEMFGYRKKWLMCEDDYKTKSHYMLTKVKEISDYESKAEPAIKTIMDIHGYTLNASGLWQYTLSDGSKEAQISAVEWAEIRDDLIDYIRYRLQRTIDLKSKEGR